MDEGRAVSLLSLAEESAAELKGLDAKAWIARLKSEYGNWRVGAGLVPRARVRCRGEPGSRWRPRGRRLRTGWQRCILTEARRSGRY
jgi:hypothetical protein